MKKLFLNLSILIFSSCVLATLADSFPSDWWKPVPDDQVAGWEIPPQAANRQGTQRAVDFLRP